PDRGAVAVAGGMIFEATVGGRLVALDAERGTQRWSLSLSGRIYAAVVATAALVVTVEIGDGGGRVAAWRPRDGGLVRGWEAPGGRCWTMPSYSAPMTACCAFLMASAPCASSMRLAPARGSRRDCAQPWAPSILLRPRGSSTRWRRPNEPILDFGFWILDWSTD